MRTRYIWKYCAARGIFGTPFAIVNGVVLQDFPTTAQEWTDMLNDVYNSQNNPTIYF
jgi:hypothetical protein